MIASKMATLSEIGSSWSLADLSDAHAVLDVQEDLERALYWQREKARR